ncbi:hypothetical protein AC578_7943 [Pseudocercospora eumusae]|uniref:Uncharacterized protein n=1 Tax=Pseudocercospora eumusae TaxID=321146 RepID=A0A139HPH6_9PEZI|nr:hypothetical protein AC578_7943 [Pseudocercospora eumusae]
MAAMTLCWVQPRWPVEYHKQFRKPHPTTRLLLYASCEPSSACFRSDAEIQNRVLVGGRGVLESGCKRSGIETSHLGYHMRATGAVGEAQQHGTIAVGVDKNAEGFENRAQVAQTVKGDLRTFVSAQPIGNSCREASVPH